MIPFEAPRESGENGAVDGWVALPGEAPAEVDFTSGALVSAAARCRERVHILRNDATGSLGIARTRPPAAGEGLSLVATLEPLYPEWLGAQDFLEAHGVRFAYCSGAMAHGIASPAMVLGVRVCRPAALMPPLRQQDIPRLQTSPQRHRGHEARMRRRAERLAHTKARPIRSAKRTYIPDKYLGI